MLLSSKNLYLFAFCLFSFVLFTPKNVYSYCSTSECNSTVSLIDTIAYRHNFVPPNQSITFVISHDYGTIPLAAIIKIRHSTTIIYTIQEIGDFVILVQAYNYGNARQLGIVTIGIWE